MEQLPTSTVPATLWSTVYMAYLTLGIVPGGVGTSPLYTIPAVFQSPPSEADVMGAVSLMLWSLILVLGLKYVVLVLFADDHGEGGTFAMYALLSRGLRQKIKSDRVFYVLNEVLAILALVGVAAVLSDGILTPSISVLSAVQGLTVISPNLEDAVVPVSCAILFVLFLFQRFGTRYVSYFFSPVLLLWFIALTIVGIYNITRAPRILRAFSPAYGFQYFIDHGFDGWASLGEIFLTLTGAEALYADMGHFNAKAIRISTMFVVMPSLLLSYCGMGAAVILDPTIVANPFYLSFPSSLFYPMLVLSTLSAIIASQSLISAAFSLTTQAMRLNCFPRMTVIHTDKHVKGQVYVPEINYFFMIATIVVVVGYGNATALGYAFGVAVSMVFFITTVFYALILVFNFERHWTWAVLFFVFFGLIDAAFLSANLLKFTTGGWFTVTIATIFSLIMALWRWGRRRMTQHQAAMSIPDKDFSSLTRHAVSPEIAGQESSSGDGLTLVPTIVPATSERNVYVVPSSFMVWYSSVPGSVPASFVHFLRRLPARPERLVFVTLVPLNVSVVQEDIVVRPFALENNVYRVTVYHGYAENIPNARAIFVRIIRKLDCLPLHLAGTSASDDEIASAMDPTFVISREKVVSAPHSPLLRRYVVEAFQILLSMSRSVSLSLAIPDEQALEIGMRLSL